VAYRSLAVSRVHLAVAVVFAAAAVVASSIDGQWWLGVLLAVVFVVVGIHLGAVRLTVDPDSVRAAQGPWGGGRVIPAAEVADVRVEQLSRGQVLGVGLPEHPKTSRLTVRPGPTLLLVLVTGEQIWVSTDDPAAAVRVVRPASAT